MPADKDMVLCAPPNTFPCPAWFVPPNEKKSVVNMCFKYMAGVMMDATSAIFVSFAIDRENGTVSNDRESMRKILNSMPCMYQLVPLNGQGAVAGQPVAMGVAVPMVTGQTSDVEMGKQ